MNGTDYNKGSHNYMVDMQMQSEMRHLKYANEIYVGTN